MQLIYGLSKSDSQYCTLLRLETWLKKQSIALISSGNVHGFINKLQINKNNGHMQSGLR